MKDKHNSVNKQQNSRDVLIYGYFLISVFNLIAFFTVDFWADSLYTLWGNHSIFYPFFGVLIAGELGAPLLVGCMIIYCGISFILLVFSYIEAILRKRFAILRTVVFLDCVFTVIFAIANVLYAGFMPLHFFVLLGAVFDFMFGRYLSVCSQD